MSLRTLAALSSATALVVAPILFTASGATNSAAASTTIDTVAASSLNCRSTVTAPFSQAQGNASTPVCANNTWVYDLPATSSPSSPRRTETHWGVGTNVVQYREGQTVVHEAVYAGELGAAAQADKDWHVLWQLHGPYRDGSWRAPIMGLNVRNGQLRLGGGSGHPQHDWSTRNYEWIAPIAKWTDGTPVRVKVESYLSSDPSKGWISAWVNGRQVLNQWRPSSYSGGLRAGTFYPGMDHVASRSGLYRGSQGATPPTYRQVMSVQVVRAG